jgi:hypothetical protein
MDFLSKVTLHNLGNLGNLGNSASSQGEVVITVLFIYKLH